MILLSNRAKFKTADYSLWNIQWEELNFESAENLILNTTNTCNFYEEYCGTLVGLMYR